MINKFKPLFLLILCAVVCGSTHNVSAQRGISSDTVLGSGKNGISQSKINKLIKFYE